MSESQDNLLPPTPATPLNDAHPAGCFFGGPTYHKKPLTTAAMIELLGARGMEFQEDDLAANTLERINYYRLSAYWFPDVNHESKDGRFIVGTKFRTALERYNFDRALRGIVWKRIEVVEVAFRRAFAFHLAHDSGPFAHITPTLASDRASWAKSFALMQREYESSQEEFATHHKQKYPDLLIPPVWATMELVSFGAVVHMYRNLNSKKLRQQIARDFGIDESVFTSWLNQILQVRNACAHHARLWNRRFSRSIKIPTHISISHRDLFSLSPGAERRLYNSLVCLDYLEAQIEGASSCLAEVSALIGRHSSISAEQIGFPGES